MIGPEITIAGWLASPLISRLMKLGIDRYLQTGVKQKLNKLQINLNKVRTIAELEKMQFESQSLRDWLWRFKEAVCIAEDVIDSLEFQLSGNKDQVSHPASSCLMPNVVRKVIQKASLFADANDESASFVRAILFPARRKIDRGDVRQLGEVVKTFGDLIHEIGDILKVVERHEAIGGAKKWSIPPFWAGMSHPTGVIPIRGRAVEEEAMLQALLETTARGESFLNCSKFSVLSIVGPGGIGKTVLAQLAFHNKVVERHFDIMAWVCVSTQFDLKRLTIKIIESASMKRPYDLHNIISLGELRKILTAGMKGKRFLIVLDDVWEESTTAWRYLLTPLNCGKEGSKIVVTTRLEEIARTLETKVMIKLDGLEEEEYLELLKDSAFGVERTIKQQPDRERMCCKIAQQLGGLPLAAVRIRGFLNDCFQRGNWPMETSLVARDGDLVSVLGQSYQQLPEHLKQCYISCALFPKNYCFERNQLLRFWMALGLTPENGAYAHNFVDDLSSRSFFVDAWRKKDKFVIHAMMHELADHICDGEFFRLEDGINDAKEIEIPMKAHHVYVTADNFVRFSKVLRKRKMLRSLVVDGRLSSHIWHSEFMDSLGEVLNDSSRLRLLMLSELPGGDMPDAIVHLRHLRYLEFPDSGVHKLPKSFCRFYHQWRLNLKTGGPKHLLLRNNMDPCIKLCALDPNLEAISFPAP